MYHELELPTRPFCQSDPGYTRYVISGAEFTSQMQWLHDAGWRGTSVGEALNFPPGPFVAITFDDGSETDLLLAAPVLRQFGFTATFYLTTSFLGRPGYLSKVQARELSALGFEIGCHSRTHAYLSDLNDAALETEIRDPKRYLEDILGHSVNHFSCPGGRYDLRVQAIVKSAGYRTLSTSRAHPNNIDTDLYELGRIAILRTTTPASFERICRGQGLWPLRTRQLLSAAFKKSLGNDRYSALQSWLLHHNPFKS